MINYSSAIGPFAHNDNTSTKIMYTVVMALLPACVYSLWQFGIESLYAIFTAIWTCIVVEWACLKIMKKPPLACLDGSAVLTGLLLAMSLPVSIPLPMVVFGSAFAIVVGKQIYGGLGQNLFNPAMLARVMMIVCFPVEMTNWTAPSPISFSGNVVTIPETWFSVDGITSATALSSERVDPIRLIDLFFGHQSGSLGETSALLLILGGVYLIYRGIVSWMIPMMFCVGLGLPAVIAHFISPTIYLDAITQLLSGGAMLCAFFISTDLVTSPTSGKGQMLYGFCTGLLVWLIRTFGSYPEGVAFAVLIMNSASPLIDYYLKPSIFGSNVAKGA